MGSSEDLLGFRIGYNVNLNGVYKGREILICSLEISIGRAKVYTGFEVFLQGRKILQGCVKISICRSEDCEGLF